MLGLPCYIDYHMVQLVSDKTYIFLEDDIPSSRYVELRHPESAIIVNDIIYCNNGVFYHLDDFDALMDEEVISDYAVCSPRA